MTKREVRGGGLDRIAEAFRTYGYDGASMSIISRETGWGRASLYHHFPGGKDDMAVKALRHIGANARALVLDPLREAGDPSVRLERFAASLAKFYRQGRTNCMLGTMALSGGMQACAEDLQEGMGEWLTALADVLIDAGYSRAESLRRAEDAVIQIQGALVVSRCMRNEEPFLRMVRELPRKMLAEQRPRRRATK